MKSRILELDALRGFAAFFVVLFHYVIFTEYEHTPLILGGTGVDLFFLISGYIIFLTITHLKRGADFIVSRFARLYPAYWTAVLFTATLHYLFAQQGVNVVYAAANLTMMHHFFGIPHMDFAYWTLLVELIFYALIYILYKTRQTERIEYWGTVMVIFVIFYFFGLAWIVPEFVYKSSQRVEFLIHAPKFVAGIFFYLIQHRGGNFFRHSMIGACFLVSFLLHDRDHTIRHISYLKYGAALSLWFAIFYAFIYGKMGWLVNRATLYLGKISYSLYLIHFGFSTMFLLPYLTNRLGLPYPVSCVVALCVCILIASAITFTIEIPANKFIRALFKKKATCTTFVID